MTTLSRAALDRHRATVGFGILFAVTMVEPRALVVDLSDTVRWAIVAVGFVAAFSFATPALSSGSSLWRRPAGFLFSAALWTLIVAPLGLKPVSDLLLAFGFVSYVLFGVWFVERWGWRSVERALSPALWVLMISSLLLIVLNGDLGARATGSVGSFNALASSAAMAAFVGVMRWSRGDRLGIALLVLALVLLVMSDGRVSQLSLVVAIAVASRERLPRWAVAFPPFALALGVGLAVWSGSADAIGDAVSRSGETEEIVTVTGRTPVWRLAIEGIGDRPISGFGAASTTEFYATSESEIADEIVFEVNDAHNIVLQSALNGGLPAAVFLVAGLVSFVRRAGGSSEPVRDGVVVIILMHGLTEHVLREPDGLTILLACALASAALSKATPTSDGERITRRDFVS